MDYKDAIAIFENNTKRSVVQIERCSVGIANYVFIVSTANEKFVLRFWLKYKFQFDEQLDKLEFV